MSTIINASTSSGLIQTADTSGTLVLQSNGTTMQTIDSTGSHGQLKSGTAVASTSGTSIDFTGLPSWVKRITVMFNGVSVSGTSNLQVQIGTSGGVETSGYIAASASSAATTTSTTGFIFTQNSAAADLWYGQLIISAIGSNSWAYMAISNNNGGIRSSAGTKTLSGTLNRVRITTVNGTDTFDAGSINILYEG